MSWGAVSILVRNRLEEQHGVHFRCEFINDPGRDMRRRALVVTMVPCTLDGNPLPLECYRSSHEIAFAEFDAAMAQDIVGGGGVEIEIRQTEI